MLEIFEKMTNIDWLIFVVTIIAYLVLATDIFLNNGISQNFFTWLLWAILDGILLIATIKEKGSDIPLIFGCVIGSSVIALLLFLIKKVKWRKIENQTLVLVVFTVIIWQWSESNLVGIIFTVTSEILAGIPLMKASWKTPGSKLTLTSYLLFIASYIISIFKAPNWGVEHVLFPISFLIYSIGDTIPLINKWWKIMVRA